MEHKLDAQSKIRKQKLEQKFKHHNPKFQSRKSITKGSTTWTYSKAEVGAENRTQFSSTIYESEAPKRAQSTKPEQKTEHNLFKIESRGVIPSGLTTTLREPRLRNPLAGPGGPEQGWGWLLKHRAGWGTGVFGGFGGEGRTSCPKSINTKSLNDYIILCFGFWRQLKPKGPT